MDKEDKMKEDKVREAIKLLNEVQSSVPVYSNMAKARELLKEAIATEPEIPEGCPVIMGNSDNEFELCEGFYNEDMPNEYSHIEIDYQRAKEQSIMLTRLLEEEGQ